MATAFKNRVRDAGFTGDLEKFYCAVAKLFSKNHPDKTYEQLARNPREALRFCELTRAELKLPDLADEVILGALENHRKHNRKSTATRSVSRGGSTVDLF